MLPLSPTATKVLFPNTTPKRLFAVGEVALSKDDPLSVDLTMFPEEPTVMNTPEPEEVLVVTSSVVVEEPSSLLLQEMIVRLIRNVEKMISRFFTWFPIYWFRRTQYITSIGLFYKNEGILLEAIFEWG